MGRAYKLYSVATTTTNATASFRVTKRSRIRCILFSIVGVAGAAIDGSWVLELSKQNTQSYSVNDTPDTVLATVCVPRPISGGAYGTSVPIICDLPLEVGDTVYLNVVTGGTASASAIHEVTCFVAD